MEEGLKFENRVYDAVVIGAGPAGLECARCLLKKGRKVLVLERSKSPGDPNFSTGGIPYFAQEEFDIPSGAIRGCVNRISYVSPNGSATFEGHHPAGFVLDFREFKRLRGQEIMGIGGEIVYGAEVFDVERGEENFRHVRFRKGGSEGRAGGRFIIEAASSDPVISEKVGVKKFKGVRPTIGEEVIVKADLDPFFKGNLSIFIGKKFIPHGYAWVFPFGGGLYKIGVIRYDYKPSNHEGNIGGHLDLFLRHIIKEATFEEVERHGGTLFLSSKDFTCSYENVAFIGDSVGLCNPLFAEGIRHALNSGRICAECIDMSLKSGLPNLRDYNKRIREYKDISWKLSRLFASLLYHFPLDYPRDLLARAVKKLTYEEIIDLGFGYKYSLLLKVLT